MQDMIGRGYARILEEEVVEPWGTEHGAPPEAIDYGVTAVGMLLVLLDYLSNSPTMREHLCALTNQVFEQGVQPPYPLFRREPTESQTD